MLLTWLRIDAQFMLINKMSVTPAINTLIAINNQLTSNRGYRMPQSIVEANPSTKPADPAAAQALIARWQQVKPMANNLGPSRQPLAVCLKPNQVG